ncbi:hypothetical protein AGDE_09355 [Angomonas deanei]|nr:hypothetical protein AGDE_09355 [Angomonas deanei]|eukprot:EPY30614.1 hypothetical protein AGDE_09355 [Angomonas deanei]
MGTLSKEAPRPRVESDDNSIGWFVEDVVRPDQYEPYNEESSTRLESAYLQKATQCMVVLKKHTYTVNLLTMQQLAPEGSGGRPRAVRRCNFEVVNGARVMARQGIVDPFNEEQEEEEKIQKANLDLTKVTQEYHSAANVPNGEVQQRIDAKQFDQYYPCLCATTIPHTTPIYTMSVVAVDDSQSGSPQYLALTGGKDKRLTEWDLQTHKVVTDYDIGSTAKTLSVLITSYSHNAQYVVVGMDDKMARVYRRGSPKVVLTLAGHLHKVYGADFSASDTRIVTAAMDNRVCLWDIATGQLVKQEMSHSSHIFAIHMSRYQDHLGVSVGDDKLVCVHDFREASSVVQRLKGHTKTIWNVDINEVGGTPTQYVTCGMDNTVRLWDCRKTEGELAVITQHTKSVHGAYFTAGGKGILSSSKDQTVLLSNATDGSPEWQLKAHTASVFRGLYLPASTSLVTCAGDATVNIWRWKGGQNW